MEEGLGRDCSFLGRKKIPSDKNQNETIPKIINVIDLRLDGLFTIGLCFYWTNVIEQNKHTWTRVCYDLLFFREFIIKKNSFV